MNMEDELKAYKQKELKRARVTSVVLGLAAVIAVLFMIYGFTQSIEAQKQRNLAGMMQQELESANNKIENLNRQLEKCESERK